MIKHCSAFVVAGALAASTFAGETYYFGAVTNNNAVDVAIGEGQFSVEVKDAGPGSVEFLFMNAGPDAASMVQLYWDDAGGVLSSLTGWSTTTPTKSTPNYGADFSGGSANPGHLPGASPSDFTDFSIQAQSQKGKSKNGVGAGENVSVAFGYSGSYQGILDAMDSGDLSVGIHAQAFASGGSESFRTEGTPPITGIPTPTAAFAGMAMMGLASMRRRRG